MVMTALPRGVSPASSSSASSSSSPSSNVGVCASAWSRAAAAAAASAVPGVTLEVQGGVNRLPLERTDASAKLRDEYAACARACGLGDTEAPLLGGGSDANTVAPLGVPAIDGLGPRGAGFHTSNEYVELDTFVPKCEALVRFLVGRLRA
jgi:glutamate carboxypeptidase